MSNFKSFGKKMSKFLAFVLLILFVFSCSQITSFADCYDSVSAKTLINIGEETSVDQIIACTHGGRVTVTNQSTDVQGHIKAVVMHEKYGILPCDHLMFWELKYSYYPRGGTAPANTRKQSDWLEVGGAVPVDIYVPLGYIVEIKLFTEVDGVKDEADLITIVAEYEG